MGNNFVFDSGADSTKKDTLNIQNQDSSLVNPSDSMHNLITLENSYHESNSIKQFFQKRSAERIREKEATKRKAAQ